MKAVGFTQTNKKCTCRNAATAAVRSVPVCPVPMPALLPDCCPSSPQLRLAISCNALNTIAVAQIIIEFTQGLVIEESCTFLS